MRKEILLRLTVAVLGLAGLWLAWSQNPPAPLTMQKVSDNVYVIVGSGGNVAFMPTSEGVILVDDKFAQDAPEIVAKVKSVSDKPIRYVLNTHQHGDHTGGNEAMLAANAEIIIQKNARANMVAGKMPGLPRITFSEETQVFLGGKEVRARYLGRGHTNGDAVIYFPSERVLHTGDLFVIPGPPFIDVSAGGSIKEWERDDRESPAIRLRRGDSGARSGGQEGRPGEVGADHGHHPDARRSKPAPAGPRMPPSASI